MDTEKDIMALLHKRQALQKQQKPIPKVVEQVVEEQQQDTWIALQSDAVFGCFALEFDVEPMDSKPSKPVTVSPVVVEEQQDGGWNEEGYEKNTLHGLFLKFQKRLSLAPEQCLRYVCTLVAIYTTVFFITFILI
jgi:hypothetical protein